MNWFWVVFFSIYAAMHATVYLRLRALLPKRPWWHALTLLWLILMVAAPALARLGERMGHHTWARFWAEVGFFWMGLVGLAFFNAVASWLLQLAVWLIRRFTPLNIGALRPRAAAAGALGLALVMSLYGIWEAGDLRVERVRLATDKLPPGVERLTLTQISDLHLGLQTSPRRLREVVELVQSTRPDLVFSTGDLVDGTMFEQDHLLEALAEMRPPLGKYAIMGNHEFYAGLELSERVLATCGFVVLRNRALSLPSLNLAGVDDPVIGSAPEAPLLAPLDRSRYTVLLKHRPWLQDEALGLFDLQLSGHTHAGQVWPFNYITRALYPLHQGLRDLGRGSNIYTNRGTGTWGPPMRIFAPPEITVIELVRAGQEPSPDPRQGGEQ